MTSRYAREVMNALHAKRVEPQRRMVAGRFGWATHRFPIKGGISLHQAMTLDLAKPNPLYGMLVGGSLNN